MTLIKTSILNSLAVLVRMATLLGLNKVLAVFLGPAGYAALGQFQNAIQMITTFASGAINNGVIKYTAEYQDDFAAQKRMWQTAGTISLIGSLCTSLVIGVLNKTLASWFLKDPSYGIVFIWFAIGLVFFTLNSFLLSILNGKKDVLKFVIINITGSVFSFFLTAFLSVQLGLRGALIGLSIYQSITFFVTLFACSKTNWFHWENIIGKVDINIAKNLAKFTGMALTSAVCVPLSQILIRDHLSNHHGASFAGYWEAMWRLSTAYLMLVTSTLSVYYLPRISELKKFSEIKKELLYGYKIILPLVATCGLMTYFLRDFIIHTLFTRDFKAMRDLFAWQMVGDTLKIGSWIVSYLMVGKAMFRMFVVTEVFFTFSFYLLTVLLTHRLGFAGVSVAHAVNYLVYWMVVGFLVLKKLMKHDDA